MMAFFARYVSAVMAFILAAVICAVLAAPLFAQPRCAPSIVVLQKLGELGEVVHESRVLPAADGSGPVQWMIWLNEETGSWTLTGTRGAVTCVFAGAMRGYSGQTIADFVLGASI